LGKKTGRRIPPPERGGRRIADRRQKSTANKKYGRTHQGIKRALRRGKKEKTSGGGEPNYVHLKKFTPPRKKKTSAGRRKSAQGGRGSVEVKRKVPSYYPKILFEKREKKEKKRWKPVYQRDSTKEGKKKEKSCRESHAPFLTVTSTTSAVISEEKSAQTFPAKGKKKKNFH